MAGLKGLKKTRRIRIIVVAFVALALSTALIGYAMRGGINFFRIPTQVVKERPSEDEVFRLGGVVKEGSVVPGSGVRFRFVITDGKTEIPVSYEGDNLKPDLFAEGTETVATGRMAGGTFVATTLLAKHDENYMPKEVADALKAENIDISQRPKPGN